MLDKLDYLIQDLPPREFVAISTGVVVGTEPASTSKTGEVGTLGLVENQVLWNFDDGKRPIRSLGNMSHMPLTFSEVLSVNNMYNTNLVH